MDPPPVRIAWDTSGKRESREKRDSPVPWSCFTIFRKGEHFFIGVYKFKKKKGQAGKKIIKRFGSEQST